MVLFKEPILPDAKLHKDLYRYQNRTVRPKLAKAGIILVFVGLLLNVFDDLWKPHAYSFLMRVDAPAFLIQAAGYIHLLVPLVGIYLIFQARNTPNSPSEKDIQTGNH
jgi:hypothetical protein